MEITLLIMEKSWNFVLNFCGNPAVVAGLISRFSSLLDETFSCSPISILPKLLVGCQTLTHYKMSLGIFDAGKFLNKNLFGMGLIFCFWFALMLNVPVNIYGHVRTVSSPNHTFFLGKVDKAVNQYFVHILLLVLTTTLLESAEGRKMAVVIIS